MHRLLNIKALPCKSAMSGVTLCDGVSCSSVPQGPESIPNKFNPRALAGTGIWTN